MLVFTLPNLCAVSVPIVNDPEAIQPTDDQLFLQHRVLAVPATLPNNRASNTVNKDVFDWDYSDPNILEFRYEDIMVDEASVFDRLFEHYGFTPEAADKAREIAAEFSFSKRTGRDVGDVGTEHHIRSGKTEQWREEFNDDHKALFKVLHGQQLIELGYAEDLNW